jgi:Nup93/Nic96.
MIGGGRNMSKSDKEFREALVGKKIPILTLDNQWHQLIGSVEPDKEVLKLQEEINELLKRQGKARTEIRKIKALKKKLMQEIMENAEDASSGKNKKAEDKVNDNKRLINECNEMLRDYEDEVLELPAKMEKVNRELMIHTMEICYDVLRKNKAEIDENARWISETRTELKRRLIRKQEQEDMNQELYNYMHNIFGVDVIDIFDMAYLNKDK